MENKLTEEELQQKLNKASEVVLVGKTYIHYKEKPYKVTQLSILESTNEVCVIYEALYGKHLSFTRPLSNWLEEVDVDGKIIQRFRLKES